MPYRYPAQLHVTPHSKSCFTTFAHNSKM